MSVCERERDTESDNNAVLTEPVRTCSAQVACGSARAVMDPSVVAAMDKDALKKQIENMKYQATMERWPLSKSIAA